MSNIKRLRKTTLYLIKSKKFRKLIIIHFDDNDNRFFIDEFLFI